MAKKQTTALATWDEELARAAEEAAGQEASTGGGKFFSTKGGQLALSGAPIPGNEIGVIIVDSILVNTFYDGAYDPDSPQSPSCYAFGRDEKTMAPHAEAEDPKSADCASCPNNQFGSAEKGRGKACKNGRRLALMNAGSFDAKTGEFQAYDDPEDFEKAEVAFLNLAPTSINSFGAYVKQLSATLRRPPFGVFTKVSLLPDPKTQFKVVFENLGSVPDELISAVIARNKELKETIAFPFPKASEREAQAPRAAAKAKPRRKF